MSAFSIEPNCLDWELVEIFCIGAKAGGFRQAQRQAGFSLETINELDWIIGACSDSATRAGALAL